MKLNTYFLITSAALVLSGCTTYKEKFQAGTVANIGFFADSTVTMMSSLDLQMGRNETLLTRRFFDRSEEEELKLIELDQEFQSTISGLVKYSIKIVNIAESASTEEEMIAKYADYLSQFKEALSEHELFDAEGFDQTLAKVREQETFLEALRAGQSLLNAVAMEAILNIEELLDAVDVLVEKVHLKIDEEYEDVVLYRHILEDEKSDILRAFAIIYTAYKSDEPELSALRESGVIWMPEIIPEGVPTRKELEKIGEHLESRLNAMHRIHQEVAPDWQDYLDTKKELQVVTKRSMTMIQRTQLMMLTWVRAHQRMAAGKVDPADWFDLSESTKNLLKAAPGAIL